MIQIHEYISYRQISTLFILFRCREFFYVRVRVIGAGLAGPAAGLPRPRERRLRAPALPPHALVVAEVGQLGQLVRAGARDLWVAHLVVRLLLLGEGSAERVV